MHFSIADFFFFFNLFSGKKKKSTPTHLPSSRRFCNPQDVSPSVKRRWPGSCWICKVSPVPSYSPWEAAFPSLLVHRGALALRGWPNCTSISNSYSKGEVKASYNVQALDQKIQHLLYLTFQSVSCVKSALRDTAAPRTCLEGSQNSVLQFCLWLTAVKSVN